MSGVWVFKNGVAQLISDPSKERLEIHEKAGQPFRRVLVHVSSNQEMSSYSELERRLLELGWERYEAGKRGDLIQFHRSSASAHLISLPRDFSKFKSIHMYDIVVKNRSQFVVRQYPA